MGEPNKCIIDVKKPKLIKSHNSVIFRVIAFIPPQKASPNTPQPAIRTIHVLSKAILFLSATRAIKAFKKGVLYHEEDCNRGPKNDPPILEPAFLLVNR